MSLYYFNPNFDFLWDFAHIVIEGSAKNDLLVLKHCIRQIASPIAQSKLKIKLNVRFFSNSEINLLNQHKFFHNIKLTSPGKIIHYGILFTGTWDRAYALSMEMVFNIPGLFSDEETERNLIALFASFRVYIHMVKKSQFSDNDIKQLEIAANEFVVIHARNLTYRYQNNKLKFEEYVGCCNPKFHKLGAHLSAYIKQYGCLLNGSTQAVERQHQRVAKNFFKNSSHKEHTLISEFNEKVGGNSKPFI